MPDRKLIRCRCTSKTESSALRTSGHSSWAGFTCSPFSRLHIFLILCSKPDGVGPSTLLDLIKQNTSVTKLRLDGCNLQRLEFESKMMGLQLQQPAHLPLAGRSLRHGGISAMNLLSPRAEHKASTHIAAAPRAPAAVLKSVLRSLDISRNRLDALPKEIFLLPRLGALNASSNNLRGIPGELWACTSLRRLELQCNPLGAGFWERGPRPRKVRPHLGDDLLHAYSDR